MLFLWSKILIIVYLNQNVFKPYELKIIASSGIEILKIYWFYQYAVPVAQKSKSNS